MFLFQIVTYHCGICQDDHVSFTTKGKCLGHLKDQHSGVLYRCRRCQRVFRKMDTPHGCNATRNDYLLFAVVTSATGLEASHILDNFMEKAVNHLCVEKLTLGPGGWSSF